MLHSLISVQHSVTFTPKCPSRMREFWHNFIEKGAEYVQVICLKNCLLLIGVKKD